MVHYFLWRMLTKRTSQNIELDFVIDEHTKFVPDQHFGNIKRRFARTFCFIFARAISGLFAIMYLLYIALFRK